MNHACGFPFLKKHPYLFKYDVCYLNENKKTGLMIMVWADSLSEAKKDLIDSYYPDIVDNIEDLNRGEP